jgi:hypothetical protein
MSLRVASAQDIPANSRTIDTELVHSEGPVGDRLIYVINRSSLVVFVTSVRLMDCENIQGNCSTRRMKTRVPPGARVMVHRVRRRSPDQGSGFRYTFTWEEEAPEGPSAKEVAEDPTALEVDTVIVSPKLIDVKVGETIDLSQALAIEATNSRGAALREIYFYPRVVLGEEFVSLEGTRLTGKAVGTAVLSIAASMVATPNPPTKGASRILVKVTP